MFKDWEIVSNHTIISKDVCTATRHGVQGLKAFVIKQIRMGILFVLLASFLTMDYLIYQSLASSLPLKLAQSLCLLGHRSMGWDGRQVMSG